MSLPVPNLELGKYAVYVWPAYAISALVIVAMLVQSLLRARRWRMAAERAPGRRVPPQAATQESPKL
jgi:heme exporter protein D